MRGFLVLVACSVFVLLAGLPAGGDTRWWLAALGCAAVAILAQLGARRERGERAQLRHVAIADLHRLHTDAEALRASPPDDSAEY